MLLKNRETEREIISKVCIAHEVKKATTATDFFYYARRSNSISDVPADNLRESVFLISLRVS